MNHHQQSQNQTPKFVFKRNQNSWMSPATIRSFLSPRWLLCCCPLWLEEAKDGVSTLGDTGCSRLEPGSVSRDGGRFQLGCLYKHVIKTSAEKQPGCSAGGRGGGKEEKAKKALGLICSCSRDPRDFTHMGETGLLSRAQPVGSETATSWTQPPRTSAEHMGRGKQGGKFPGMKSEPIS